MRLMVVGEGGSPERWPSREPAPCTRWPTHPVLRGVSAGKPSNWPTRSRGRTRWPVGGGDEWDGPHSIDLAWLTSQPWSIRTVTHSDLVDFAAKTSQWGISSDCAAAAPTIGVASAVRGRCRSDGGQPAPAPAAVSQPGHLRLI